ncbi:MAG: hypothetical protein ACRCY3_04430 [Sphingorhabdus sp.]
MIDNFSILLSHSLILLAFWYLSRREDLDREPPPVRDAEPEGFGIKRRQLVPKAKRPALDA